MFERFFKPKWKNAKAETRKLGVAELNPYDEKQNAILTDLALLDPDNGVRAAAIAKVTSPVTLSSLLLGKETNEIQQVIVDRLLALFQQNALDQQQLLGALDTSASSLLAQAILDGSVPVQLKQTALNFIKDESLLTKLACEHPHASVRQSAAEQVQDFAALEAILKVAKNKDKTIYRIVKERLAEHRAVQSRLNEEKARREEVVKQLETHGRISFDPIYAAKFEHLKQQWQQLQGGADVVLVERANKALDACEEVISAHEAELQARKLAASEKEQAEIERNEAIAQLEKTLESLSAPAQWEHNSLPSLNAILKTQTARWDEANRVLLANKASAQRFERVHLALSQFVAVASEWAQLEEDAKGALANFREDIEVVTPRVESAAQTLTKITKRVRWPESFAKPTLLAEVEAALHDFNAIKQVSAEKSKAKLAEAKQAIEQLKAALGQGALKSANKHLNEAQHMLRELPYGMAEKLLLQLRELTQKVNELRDWQGYVTTPKKVQLCESMEQLIEAELDPASKADAIKALQEEWRALGATGPHGEQALWERFKAASDKAWEPCSDYFAQQAEVRQKNLAERERVIAELKQYLEQTEWANPDWKLAQQVYEVARHDWQRFNYVDRKPGQETQKQFDHLIESLKQKIEQEREKNAGLKQALVKRAEALLSEADANQAVNRAKELQQQWKEIGHAGHKQDRDLWKAFRTACDGIFEKRNQQRDAKREQDQGHYQNARDLIEALERLAEDVQSEARWMEQEMDRLEKEFEATELNEKQRHALRGSFQNALRNARRAVQSAHQRVHEARWQHAEARADVCASLETALLNGQALSDLDISIAQAEFQNAGEMPKHAEAGLMTRFSRALTAAESGNPEALGDAAANLEALHILTLRSEILMDIASPDADREKRMEYAVSRLQAGQRETRQRSPQLAEELWSEWLAIGVADAEKRAHLYERFQRAIKMMMDGR